MREQSRGVRRMFFGGRGGWWVESSEEDIYFLLLTTFTVLPSKKDRKYERRECLMDWKKKALALDGSA
jgi:hypothetical protein